MIGDLIKKLVPIGIGAAAATVEQVLLVVVNYGQVQH